MRSIAIISDVHSLIKMLRLKFKVYTQSIRNDNWTEWSAIWFKIVRVIAILYDFRPKLQDTKFNCHFITSILRSHNFIALTLRCIVPVAGLLKIAESETPLHLISFESIVNMETFAFLTERWLWIFCCVVYVCLCISPVVVSDHPISLFLLSQGLFKSLMVTELSQWLPHGCGMLCPFI